MEVIIARTGDTRGSQTGALPCPQGAVTLAVGGGLREADGRAQTAAGIAADCVAGTGAVSVSYANTRRNVLTTGFK